jgi:ubiquinol-cytochrome c reductase cytochrome c1 subunit
MSMQALTHRHGIMAAATALVASVPAMTLLSAEIDAVPPPHYPWRHTGPYSSYDHAALRRGFQVYREVCATCHSLELVRWRELVGVTHTKEEVVAICKEVDVLDGPNQEGDMFERPAKLYDRLPSPYTNKQQAASANNGANPPDLSLMVKAREEGLDYVMALLTGYMEAPAGRHMMEGLYYNPYFEGGGIAMPPPLQDDGIEYPDGTPATIAQQARDLVQFLNWTAEPEMEVRKKNGAVYMLAIICMCIGAGYNKRIGWSSLKSRKIAYVKDWK